MQPDIILHFHYKVPSIKLSAHNREKLTSPLCPQNVFRSYHLRMFEERRRTS